MCIRQRTVCNYYVQKLHKKLILNLLNRSIDDIPPKAKTGIKDFLDIIHHYNEIFTVDKNTLEKPKLYENINKFLDTIAYHNEVLNSSDTKEQGSKKIENIESLMNGIAEYEKGNKNATLKNYLDRILL